MRDPEQIENAIEWLAGDDQIVCTFNQRKYITKIRKLKEKFPDQVEYKINKDGSMYAKLPLSALKLSIREPREMSEEEKALLAERMRKVRAKVENS